MFKFKYLSVALFVAILAGVVVASCNDDKTDLKAEGVKAGTEMCACVGSYDAPVQPQHPASPLPPADFNPQNPDLTDPATLAYVSDPAIIAYFGELETFMDDFNAYAQELYQCLGVTQKYQKYVTANANNYNPTATDPLLSVFTFTNDDFKEGFKEGVSSCSEAFNALFALMPSE